MIPAGSVASGYFVSVNPVIAVGHNASPYITAYPWSTSGFGTKYANPATLPAGANAVAFSPSGNAMALGEYGPFSSYIGAYPWSASGFGTRYANPATQPGLPQAQADAAAITALNVPLGRMMAVTLAVSAR